MRKDGGERADWNEAEESEGGERESEEWRADPGMLVMQREEVRQQVLHEEAVQMVHLICERQRGWRSGGDTCIERIR